MLQVTTLARAAAIAALCTLAALAHATHPADIPTEAFFDFDELSDPVMSPSGKLLAILVRGKDGHRQLAVLETANPARMRVIANFTDGDVERPHWVNEARLVYSSSQESEAAAERHGGSLYATNSDGTDTRMLIHAGGSAYHPNGMVSTRTNVLDWQYSFLQTLHDGSGDIIVEHAGYQFDGAGRHYHGELTYTVPVRLDTRTGEARQLVPAPVPGHVDRWLIDDQGRVLGGVTHQGGRTTLLVPGDTPGTFVARRSFATYGDSEGYAFDGVGADGRVYVRVSNAKGFDELHRLDMKTGTPEPEPVVTIEGFDFSGRLVNDHEKHRVAGIDYASDAAGTAWFDPALKALQDKVDAKLRGRVNLLERASAERPLVISYSDRVPVEYLLYDRARDALIPIGSSRPAIDPALMARTDFVRIRSRDDHDLPVYVTKPLGKGPWPAVVLVHGGPFLRGWEWDWDAESQFLASRGYLVVKPEFRGSAGYGDDLYRAGFRQWGLKMQDDIADATLWAEKQGLADPERTCIAGASYGGYASLMGLVRYGELYQCGIAWSAVTDIDLMYDLWWSDAADEWKGYGMPEMVGDKVKDARQFAQTSPLQQAARIKRPLLLAHGGVDHRVPVEHAMQLRSALEAAHAPLTWVFYPDEAHGWYKPGNRADFYRRMEAFLAANIGSAPAARPSTR